LILTPHYSKVDGIISGVKYLNIDQIMGNIKEEDSMLPGSSRLMKKSVLSNPSMFDAQCGQSSLFKGLSPDLTLRVVKDLSIHPSSKGTMPLTQH
jgi:hypothetical protein